VIYDIFQFNNELDLLELRLNTLKDFVDVFIITESIYTYSGNKKSLYFDEHKGMFKSDDYAVFHIILGENMPFKTPTKSRVKRKTNEHVQRNLFMNHIQFKSDDILLIGDVDEIPNPLITDVIEHGFDQPIRLRQKFYYYYMNCRCENDWLSGTVMLKGKDFTSFSELRKKDIPIILEPGGWHFSYIFNDISEKIGNLAGAEFDLEKFKSKDWIDKCLRDKKDIFNRDIKYHIEELDVPEYVTNNIDKYRKYICNGI